MIFKEMTDNQRRVFIDTIQLHEAFVSTFNKNLSYRGGMHWKKSKDREYLFRSRDRSGYGNKGDRSIIPTIIKKYISTGKPVDLLITARNDRDNRTWVISAERFVGKECEVYAKEKIQRRNR